MRSTVALMLTTCLAVAACGGEPTDDTAGDLLEMDTSASGTSVAPAAEVETSPDAAVPGAADANEPRPSNGADAPTEDRQNTAPDETADESPSTDDGAADDDTADDVAAAIPARFRGEWNAELDACGTGQSATRLRISADRVRFYESTGVVEQVEVESDRVIRVTAEYQGEGQTWTDERRMTLSADGSSLTVSNGGDLVRHRCP